MKYLVQRMIYVKNLLLIIPKGFSKLDNWLTNSVFKRQILPISSQRGLTKSHSQKNMNNCFRNLLTKTTHRRVNSFLFMVNVRCLPETYYRVSNSGVARAFTGGRAAHPEDQNEEENEENLRKNESKYLKMRKDWGNVLILPTWEWEAGYSPGE